MNKKHIYLTLLVLFAGTAAAQLSGFTRKAIDIIESNTGNDISLEPTVDVRIESANVISDRAMITGSNDELITSVTTAAEIAFVNLVTSPIQTQLDGKEPTLPLTTQGDLLYEDSGRQRLAIGTLNQILAVSSGGIPEWVAQPSSSPTTTEGDLIINDGGGAASDIRLPIGTVDQLLTSDGTTASWEDAPTSTTLTTKGDIQGFSTVNARIPVGVDGEFLVADSGEVLGVKYTNTLSGFLNPVTDWETYPCVFTGFTLGNGTATCRFREIGDSIDISMKLTLGSTSVLTGSVIIDIPVGKVIDLTKIAGIQFIDSIELTDASVFTNSELAYIRTISAATGVEIITGNGLPLNSTTPFTWAVNDRIAYTAASIPIVGQSSGTSAAVQNTTLEIPVATDWEAFTPVVDNLSVGNGTVEAYFRRIGDSISITYNISFGSTTSVTGGLSLNMPNSLVLDTAKMPSLSGIHTNNSVTYLDSSTGANREQGVVRPTPGSNLLQLVDMNENQVTATVPFTWATNDLIMLTVTDLPIVGFNATEPVSAVIAGTFENINSTDLIEIRYSEDEVTALTNNVTTNLAYDTLIDDNSNGAYIPATGIFTNPRPSRTQYIACIQSITQSGNWNAGTLADIGIDVSIGTDLSFARPFFDVAQTSINVEDGNCYTVGLDPSETLRFKYFQNSGVTQNITGNVAGNFMSISELPTTESVIANLTTIVPLTTARGRGNVGTVITTAVTPIDFTIDTGNDGSWSGTQFTAPRDGAFVFNGLSNWSTSATRLISIHVDDGTGFTIKQNCSQDNLTTDNTTKFHCTVDLEKGDLAQIRLQVGTGTLTNSNFSHWLTIDEYVDAAIIIADLETQDVVQVKAEKLDAQSIPNSSNTAMTYPTENIDNFNAWDGTTFTSPKTTTYKVCATSILEAALYPAGFFYQVEASVSGGEIVKLHRHTIGSAATIQPQVGGCGTIQMNSGQTMVFNVFQTQGNARNTFDGDGVFHNMSILEVPDTTAIIAELSNECQTKFLAADQTGVAASPVELTFNNVEIGKRYIVEMQGAYEFTNVLLDTPLIFFKTGAGTHCVGELIGSKPGGLNGSATNYTRCAFTAVDTSIPTRLDATQTGNSWLGNGTIQETWVRLCEDNSTEETTKFN